MKLRNKYKLKWLRISMSYHKFANLRELFQGDLTKKIMDGVESIDFKSTECNCASKSKVNGECIYGDMCNEKVVVYKATCKCCGMYYLGCTQNSPKNRFTQHLNQVKNLVEKGKRTTSFADHFASHFKHTNQVTVGEIREILTVEIVWKGNPIGCMKTLGKKTCALCMRERIAIIDSFRWDRKKLINSNSEIYGACRHKTRFHRLERNNIPSTDDGQDSPERGCINNTITSASRALSKVASRCYCSVI